MAKQSKSTSHEKIRLYKTTAPLLDAMFGEVKTLSNKKPDGGVSPAKITMINRLLDDVKKVVEGEPEAKYLDLLDEVNVPQYSDVAILLSQFVAAMKAYRRRYVFIDNYKTYWRTDRGPKLVSGDDD